MNEILTEILIAVGRMAGAGIVVFLFVIEPRLLK